MQNILPCQEATSLSDSVWTLWAVRDEVNQLKCSHESNANDLFDASTSSSSMAKEINDAT